MTTTAEQTTAQGDLGSGFYLECSLPSGVTIAEYRRSRPRRVRRWRRRRS